MAIATALPAASNAQVVAPAAPVTLCHLSSNHKAASTQDSAGTPASPRSALTGAGAALAKARAHHHPYAATVVFGNARADSSVMPPAQGKGRVSMRDFGSAKRLQTVLPAPAGRKPDADSSR